MFAHVKPRAPPDARDVLPHPWETPEDSIQRINTQTLSSTHLTFSRSRWRHSRERGQIRLNGISSSPHSNNQFQYISNPFPLTMTGVTFEGYWQKRKTALLEWKKGFFFSCRAWWGKQLFMSDEKQLLLQGIPMEMAIRGRDGSVNVSLSEPLAYSWCLTEMQY